MKEAMSANQVARWPGRGIDGDERQERHHAELGQRRGRGRIRRARSSWAPKPNVASVQLSARKTSARVDGPKQAAEQRQPEEHGCDRFSRDGVRTRSQAAARAIPAPICARRP